MLHYDKELDSYYEYHKLENGQTALFALSQYRYDKHRDLYVIFGISDKKKYLRQWFKESGSGDFDTKVTGKCGVEGLLWAYNKIEESIEYFQKDFLWYYNIIVCASDRRRFIVYEHFLKRLGFKKQNIQGVGMALIKKVEKTSTK